MCTLDRNGPLNLETISLGFGILKPQKEASIYHVALCRKKIRKSFQLECVVCHNNNKDNNDKNNNINSI